jgi:hypothetical protein
MQQAIEQLQEADTYAPVHISLFNQAVMSTLGFEIAVGWQVVSHRAILANSRCMLQLMDSYLGDNLSGKQPWFGVVDWLRACLIVVIACPQLQGWIDQEQHGGTHAKAQRELEVGGSDSVTVWREQEGEVFLWARELVWDLATVLGQMPVCRQGIFKRGESAALFPWQERERITNLLLQRQQGKRGHDDEIRHDDTRVEHRRVACRWLGALMAQRVRSMDRLLAQGEGALLEVKKRREAGNEGDIIARLSGRTHWEETDVGVEWHVSCTEDKIAAIREPALYQWVQSAQCALITSRMGPGGLIQAPGASSSATRVVVTASEDGQGADADPRWESVSREVSLYEGNFDRAPAVRWSRPPVSTHVHVEQTLMPWDIGKGPSKVTKGTSADR